MKNAILATLAIGVAAMSSSCVTDVYAGRPGPPPPYGGGGYGGGGYHPGPGMSPGAAYNTGFSKGRFDRIHRLGHVPTRNWNAVPPGDHGEYVRGYNAGFNSAR